MNFTETKNYCNILGEALGKFARCFDANYEAPEFRQLQNCYRSICFLDPLEVKQEVLENSTFENVVTVAELYKEQCQHIMNHKRNDIDAEDFEVLFAKLHTEEQKKQYFDLLLSMNERYYDAIEALQDIFARIEGVNETVAPFEYPERLNNAKFIACVEAAKAKGWIKQNGNCLEWAKQGRGSQSQLAYFIGKAMPDIPNYSNGDYPEQAAKEIFGIGKLSTIYYQCLNASKLQPWRSDIDKLISSAV